MSEPFLNEMSEELEGTEALSREMQELNEMTNEPGSYIEGKIDASQSEAIESSFNELVNTALESPDSLGESLPIPMPKEGPEGATAAKPADELAESNPVPIPKEPDDVASSPPEGMGESQAPAAEDDWESPNVNVAIDPEPILRETGDASIDPRPIIMEGEQVAATVAFNITGEVSATYDGSTVSLIPENDAESPQGIDPEPIFSETASEDSSPDLIGENG